MVIPERIQIILHLTCLLKHLPPQLDRIVVFDYYGSENLMLDINNYRQDINRDAVVIYVLLGQMYVL